MEELEKLHDILNERLSNNREYRKIALDRTEYVKHAHLIGDMECTIDIMHYINHRINELKREQEAQQ